MMHRVNTPWQRVGLKRNLTLLIVPMPKAQN